MSEEERILQDMLPHLPPSLIVGVFHKLGHDLEATATYLLSADPSSIPAFLQSGAGDEGEGDSEEGGVALMVSMGFDPELCELMLQHYGGDVRVATEALLEGHVPEEIKQIVEISKMADGENTTLVKDATALLNMLKTYDAEVKKMVDSEAIFLSAAPSLPASVQTDAIRVFDEMLQRFVQKKFLRKYHGGSGEVQELRSLKVGEGVPGYFANAGGGSMYQRKVLSMAGLRNLIREGAAIYGDLQKRTFSGDPAQYGSNRFHRRI